MKGYMLKVMVFAVKKNCVGIVGGKQMTRNELIKAFEGLIDNCKERSLNYV